MVAVKNREHFQSCALFSSGHHFIFQNSKFTYIVSLKTFFTSQVPQKDILEHYKSRVNISKKYYLKLIDCQGKEGPVRRCPIYKTSSIKSLLDCINFVILQLQIPQVAYQSKAIQHKTASIGFPRHPHVINVRNVPKITAEFS